MRTILITGRNGFVGRNLHDYLSGYSYYNLCGLIRTRKEYNNHNDYVVDITNSLAVREVLQVVKPDVICHLAANANGKPDFTNPNGAIYDNVIGTHNLLTYAPEGCKFIFASSIVIYGDSKVHKTEGDIPHPTSIYGASKLGAEGLVDAYTKMGNVLGTNFRLSAMVGKHLTHGVVKDIIRKIKSDSKELELFGDAPGTKKPYTHVSDICKLFRYAIDGNFSGNFNACVEDNLTIAELADIIMGELGIHKPIKFLGNKSTWKGDNKILTISRRKLGYTGILFKYNTSESALRQCIQDLQNE